MSVFQTFFSVFNTLLFSRVFGILQISFLIVSDKLGIKIPKELDVMYVTQQIYVYP